MCGISGVFLKANERLEESTLRRMSHSIAYRGPDADGIYQGFYFGLTHRRLKIIDLSDQANQPMVGPSGKVRISFNGEIYNFLELRADLEKQGYEFRTRSDTEVILVGYEAWGIDLFVKLNGIFAFAILDERGAQPTCLLVRDRFGVKPLFYTHQEGRFAFASTLRPLLSLDWLDREISPQIIYHFLQFSHIPSPHAVLNGVKQLPPGTWLSFRMEKVEVNSYWQLGDLFAGTAASSEKVSTEDYTEKDWLRLLESTLLQSVQRQQISDVPIGCFLSGGVDSSLIASAYAQISSAKILTFSIGFQESDYDESIYAREVAKVLGAEHHEWIVSPRDVQEVIPQITEYVDQPFADPSILPTFLLMKWARKKVTVGFSGDGGDELFFGYDYQKILLKLSSLHKVPKRIRMGLFAGLESMARGVNWGVKSLAMQRIIKLCEILQYSDEADLFQYFVGMIGPLRNDRVADLLVNPSQIQTVPEFQSWLPDIAQMKWSEQIRYVFLKTFLVDTVLTKTDRASMAHGLEARVPFLADEMVEFARKLPFDFKYRNGTKKYLLRRLLQKKFPSTIYARKKQGFNVPLAEWLRTDLRYLLHENLSKERLQSEGIFCPEKVEQLVNAHLCGQANHSHLLWSLISLQLWKENYRL